MKKACLSILLLMLLGALAAEGLSPADFSRRVQDEVNAIRARRELPPLIWLDELAGLASLHSGNMASKDFFDHKDPEGLQVSQRQKIHFPNLLLAGIGENLFFIENSRKIFDPKEIALGWMNSPGHRENILSTEFTHAGTGVCLQDDKLYTTIVFGIPVARLVSQLPPQMRVGESYLIDLEYLAREPRDGFNCLLTTPDPNTKVKIDLITYSMGSMPLELVWKDGVRLSLKLEFKYGAGTYTLQTGWGEYFYPDMMEFRAE